MAQAQDLAPLNSDVAIGGESLMGRHWSIAGTLIGAIILGTVRNGLTLMDVQAF